MATPWPASIPALRSSSGVPRPPAATTTRSAGTVNGAAGTAAAHAGDRAVLDEQPADACAGPEHGAGGDGVVDELAAFHFAPQRQPSMQRAPQSNGCARAGSMNLSCGASPCRATGRPRRCAWTGAAQLRRQRRDVQLVASAAASASTSTPCRPRSQGGGGALQPAYIVVAPPSMSGR
jgi:hypothetical protein